MSEISFDFVRYVQHFWRLYRKTVQVFDCLIVATSTHTKTSFGSF